MTKIRTKYSRAATVEDRRYGAREPTTFFSLSPDQLAEIRTRLAAAGHDGMLLDGVPLRVKALMGLTMAQAAEEGRS